MEDRRHQFLDHVVRPHTAAPTQQPYGTSCLESGVDRHQQRFDHAKVRSLVYCAYPHTVEQLSSCPMSQLEALDTVSDLICSAAEMEKYYSCQGGISALATRVADHLWTRGIRLSMDSHLKSVGRCVHGWDNNIANHVRAYNSYTRSSFQSPRRVGVASVRCHVEEAAEESEDADGHDGAEETHSAPTFIWSESTVVEGPMTRWWTVTPTTDKSIRDALIYMRLAMVEHSIETFLQHEDSRTPAVLKIDPASHVLPACQVAMWAGRRYPHANFTSPWWQLTFASLSDAYATRLLTVDLFTRIMHQSRQIRLPDRREACWLPLAEFNQFASTALSDIATNIVALQPQNSNVWCCDTL